MNKRKYFTDLISLYEAAGDMGSTEEVVPQEQIADSGSDVDESSVAEEDPNSAEDPSMINDPSMMPAGEPPTQTTKQLLEAEKLKKLFQLMKDLRVYTATFLESLEFIDYSLLEDDEKVLLKTFISNLSELKDKIYNYIINLFEKDKYENILYTYILFRTDLITTIKGIRDLLKLNDVKVDENDINS